MVAPGLSRANTYAQVTAGDGWVTAQSATTDATGRAATNWYLGPKPGTEQTLRAAAGGLSVTFSATAEPLVAGTTYYGASQFVEFTPGDLPLVVSAPHGGLLEPASIPTRSASGAVTVRDTNTEELARQIAESFTAQTGAAPHTIIMRLRRTKLDANREITEAAEGNEQAARAWREYHGFIVAAREQVAAEYSRGFYIDLHGHGHEIQRLELGYLLSANDLAANDDALNSSAFILRSSIRNLAGAGGASHAALLRGADALGTLFEANGFPSVPSASQPYPNPGEAYFTGGYNTRRHSSREGGPIDGVQVEANFTGVRDTATNRETFANALVHVMREYLAVHYDIVIGSG
ncbi:hypothetical protein BH23GEM10_BH23GEM10_18000 [soil metagenome]